MRILICVIAMLIMASLAAGQISVQPTVASLPAAFPSTKATTQFAVFNNGPEHVKVTKILTSCNCATANIDTMDIPPGGKAVLTTDIDTTLKAGVNNEILFVYTEGAKNPTVLRVELILPDVVSLSAKNLNWNIGDKQIAKTISVAISPGLDGSIVRIQIAEAPYLTVKQDIQQDGSYLIQVTPQETAVNMLNAITLSISVNVTVDGRRVLKTEQIVVPVSVLSPPTTKLSK